MIGWDSFKASIVVPSEGIPAHHQKKRGRRGVDQKISVSEEQTSLPKLFSGSGVSWPNTLPRVLQPASRLSTSLGPSLAISFAQILV
jgi:hypothetical protein